MTEEKFSECIQAMNRGDKDGLRQVYEEYVSYIYGIVRSLLASREEAEDATSEFFIKLWEKSDSYRAGNGHKGWMATIARNLAIDTLRKKRREEPVDFQMRAGSGEEDCTEAASRALHATDGKSVEEEVVGSLTVKEAFSLLKEPEREVVHLKIMSGMTFQEIADLLGSPMGTVTWRYREAMKKLRRYGYEEA